MLGYILMTGVGGAMLLGWLTGQHDLIVVGALLGGVLGYALQLGKRIRRLEERLGRLADFRPPPAVGEPLRARPESDFARASVGETAVSAERSVDVPVPPEQPAAEPSVEPPVSPGGGPPRPLDATPDRWSGKPAGPELPGAVENVVARLRAWLAGGNPVVQVGVVVLFFGVAFLIKYAAERDLLPIELRLTGIALGGLALLLLGWRLRSRTGVYAQVLQGGGVGVLYLTVFAAAKLYGLIPPEMALLVMLGLVLCSGVLAVLQEALALALFGSAGGFLAPVLTSTGGGSHVLLFSYYALLNAGILGISWFRAWRVLNLAGFLFTFVIGSAWGYQYYRPEHFATTEPFLLVFFLFYVAIAILFARRQEPRLTGTVDGGLVFGVPLVAFALQAALVRDYEYGLAWSALALGGFYLSTATLLWRRSPPQMRLLTESFLALGVVFASLAIPLALDGRWTASAWSLEGAALVWVGVRQGRWPARAFGLLLQLGGGVAFLSAGYRPAPVLPVLNGDYLGALAVALAGLFSAWYLQARRQDLLAPERALSLPLLIWGLLWWVWAGWNEADRYLTGPDQGHALLAFLALSAFAAGALGQRLDWRALAVAAATLLPLLVLAALAQLGDHRYPHPLDGWGGLVWPLALTVSYRLLWRLEAVWPTWVARYWHPLGLWLLLLLLTLELSWWIGRALPEASTWRYIAWALVPGLALAFLWRMASSVAWPMRVHHQAYSVLGLAPVAVYLYLWELTASALPGTADPLPYLPLLSPLDLAQGFALLALGRWCRWLTNAEDRPLWGRKPLVCWALLAVGGFVWLNTLVARTVHFWGGVGYSVEALHHSVVFQAAVSILWTCIALALMLLARWLSRRGSWLVGAGLLAVAVLKLFLVDLSGIGTLARIVSFLAVGGLMLVIGYFAPLPPRQSGEKAI